MAVDQERIEHLEREIAKLRGVRETLGANIVAPKIEEMETERDLLIQTGGGALVAGNVDTRGGDFIGRDKILNQVNNIYQQVLSQVDEAEKARSVVARRLAEGIREYTERLRANLPGADENDDALPYRGLQSYRLSDAGRFFGRSQSIAELLRAIRQDALCVLHAQSGAGKSSLLQAGIAPRLLSAGGLTVYIRAYNALPTLALKRAFLPDVSEIPELLDIPLRDFLYRVTRILGRATRLYIFLDQFEEFFTFLDAPSRAKFVDDLATCLEDQDLGVYWVLAMRSEYFSELAGFRPRIRNPFANDYRLNRLSRQEAQEVVTAPAARQKIEIEPDLVTDILDDLQGAGSEIDPPQLQLICSALYQMLLDRLDEKPGTPRRITQAMYEEEGRAQGILGDYLNRALQHLTRDERQTARLLFVALVSSDRKRIRRPVSALATELHADTDAALQGLKSLLEVLVLQRLLNVINDESVDETSFELAHDYLLDAVELTEEMKERKEAQEILSIGSPAYRRFGTVLSAAQLQIVLRHKAHLSIDAAAAQLIAESEKAIYPRPGINLAKLGKEDEAGTRILERALQLREYMSGKVPARTGNDNLLIATWAMRDFGARPILDEALAYIAEVISYFDLVALQEIKNDLGPLQKVMDLLGPYWDVVHSDTALGVGGNNERFAFLYDTRKVQHEGFSGGLVIAPKGLREAAIQPARAPYMAGFQWGSLKLTFISVHIIYGKTPADRVDEVQQIGEALKMRSRREETPQVLLGDMQVDSPDSPVLKTLRDSGFTVPEKIASLSSFASRERPFDQIAILPGEDGIPFEIGQGGVVNPYEIVFRPEDEDYYAPAMGETYQDKDDGTRSRHYLFFWRTYQMSDHLPKWLELRT